jgi:hypothetical protein
MAFMAATTLTTNKEEAEGVHSDKEFGLASSLIVCGL